eukprot:993204-Prymnesium_polylepis.1
MHRSTSDHSKPSTGANAPVIGATRSQQSHTMAARKTLGAPSSELDLSACRSRISTNLPQRRAQ